MIIETTPDLPLFIEKAQKRGAEESKLLYAISYALSYDGNSGYKKHVYFYPEDENLTIIIDTRIDGRGGIYINGIYDEDKKGWSFHS